MGILTGPEIRKQIELGSIEIDPLEPDNIGENSIDLRLGRTLKWYHDVQLDMLVEPQVCELEMSNDGFILEPNMLYLGHTVESVYSNKFASYITGRSSVGRLGLAIHWTAGLIDVGFRGQITLEVVTVHPIRIYPNTRICQLTFHDVIGDIVEYRGRYQNQNGPVMSLGSSEEHGSFVDTRK